jgi:hypothetical protein
VKRQCRAKKLAVHEEVKKLEVQKRSQQLEGLSGDACSAEKKKKKK